MEYHSIITLQLQHYSNNDDKLIKLSDGKFDWSHPVDEMCSSCSMMAMATYNINRLVELMH